MNRKQDLVWIYEYELRETRRSKQVAVIIAIICGSVALILIVGAIVFLRTGGHDYYAGFWFILASINLYLAWRNLSHFSWFRQEEAKLREYLNGGEENANSLRD